MTEPRFRVQAHLLWCHASHSKGSWPLMPSATLPHLPKGLTKGVALLCREGSECYAWTRAQPRPALPRGAGLH